MSKPFGILQTTAVSRHGALLLSYARRFGRSLTILRQMPMLLSLKALSWKKVEIVRR